MQVKYANIKSFVCFKKKSVWLAFPGTTRRGAVSGNSVADRKIYIFLENVISFFHLIFLLNPLGTLKQEEGRKGTRKDEAEADSSGESERASKKEFLLSFESPAEYVSRGDGTDRQTQRPFP